MNRSTSAPFNPGAAVHVTFRFVANNHEFGIRREVIKELEIVRSHSAQLIQNNPVMRPHVNQTAPVGDGIFQSCIAVVLAINKSLLNADGPILSVWGSTNKLAP